MFRGTPTFSSDRSYRSPQADTAILINALCIVQHVNEPRRRSGWALHAKSDHETLLSSTTTGSLFLHETLFQTPSSGGGVGHALFQVGSLFSLGDRDGFPDDPVFGLLLLTDIDFDFALALRGGGVFLTFVLVQSGPVANVLAKRSVREGAAIE